MEGQRFSDSDPSSRIVGHRQNVNDYLERIDWEEPKIHYLEIEEVKRLAATPCKVDVLKRASLFACMTGLRIS